MAVAVSVTGGLVRHRVPFRLAFVALALGLVSAVTSASAAPLGRMGGDQLWLDQFERSDQAAALVVSPDGSRLYVTGGSYEYATVAYDAVTGDRLWVARYDGSQTSYDTPVAVRLSPGADVVYVTGWSRTELFGNYNYVTIAYDAATGSTLWLAKFVSPDVPVDLQMSEDGQSLFVVGTSFNVVAYEAATGTQLWVARYMGIDQNGADAKSVDISSDGAAVFVTGASTNGVYNNFATVAFDTSSGAKLWIATYDGTGHGGDTPYGIAASPDGSKVFVTGCGGTSDECVGADYLTIAYDASTGLQLWLSTYDGPSHGIDSAGNVVVSPDGSQVFVSGISLGLTSYDYATVAYDSHTGAGLWVSRYNAPGNRADYSRALAVAPDSGTVFVTGWTAGGGGYGSVGIATLAYDATSGGTNWVARYDGPSIGPEYPADLEVSPDSTVVFLTASVIGLSSDGIVTIAYAA